MFYVRVLVSSVRTGHGGLVGDRTAEETLEN